MLIVIVWWLWMGVVGLAALPLCYRFFRRLPDRGYAFARPLGLLLTCYLLWMGASLGLLRNTVGGALASLLVLVATSVLVYQRGRTDGEPGLWNWLRANGRLVLAVELLFAGALALWSLLRAYSPDLTTAGGEKFMEIMYLNSIDRSQYFPPHDAWLGGYAISYYYFGYVMMAMLTRLSGFAAHLTFNVGVALLFALTCTGAFGVVYNLVKGMVSRSDRPGEATARPVAYGFLGAILVGVLGNLEGLLEVLYSARLLPERFWIWLDIVELKQPFDPGGAASLMPTRSGWWWWRASRVIHDLDPAGNSMGIQPIDEFPGFSFLLGDMHPHVLALPFVLLVLGVVLRELLEAGGRREPDDDRKGIKAWLEPVRQISPLVPLCLGALGFLNTWDFPIYLVVFVAAYGLGRWSRYGRLNGLLLRDVGVTGAAVAIFGFLLYMPFYVGFQSQAGGLLPTLYVGTRFRQYFVMFGPFLVAIAGMLAVLTRQLHRQVPGKRLLGRWAWWTAAFILVPLGAMLLIVVLMLLMPQGREFLEGIRRIPFVQELVGDGSWPGVVASLLLVKMRTWVMPLVVAGMAGLCAVLLVPPSSVRAESESVADDLYHSSVRFALICAIFGLLLTLSVEFVYLVDVFRTRMNTIFKFYFQAWILMALASAFAVYWLGRKRDWLRLGFLAVFWLVFAMGMFYPVFGNAQRAGMFDHSPRLDGTAYLAESKPGDYAAITWLNEHVDGTPLILETPGSGGSSYVYEGRVSALTGLPTLLGWAGHEGQWRGSYTIQEARDPDIKTIYNTLDQEVAQSLLDNYGVTYVYVGPVERATFDARALDKFQWFMDVVYEEGDVTIYRARD